jgi:hypothetical protein
MIARHLTVELPACRASFVPALRHACFHHKRAAPDHFGINTFCLDRFDQAVLPVRAIEGADMTVVCDQSRAEWLVRGCRNQADCNFNQNRLPSSAEAAAAS